MPMVRLDSETFEQPRMLAAGPLAVLLHVAGSMYARRLLTDGFIPLAEVGRLVAWDGVRMYRPEYGGPDGSASAVYSPVDPYILASYLCREGVWRRIGDHGFAIVGHLLDNPDRAEIEAQRAREAEKMARRQSRLNGVTAESRDDDESDQDSGSDDGEIVDPLEAIRPEAHSVAGQIPNVTGEVAGENRDLTAAAGHSNLQASSSGDGEPVVTTGTGTNPGVVNTPGPGDHPVETTNVTLSAPENQDSPPTTPQTPLLPPRPVSPAKSSPVTSSGSPAKSARTPSVVPPAGARDVAGLSPEDPELARLKDGAGYVSPSGKQIGAPRVQEFMDEVQRLRPGLKVLMNPRNAGALNQSKAAPAFIAEAYVAARQRKWGGRWLQENMSVWAVVDHLDSYAASIQGAEPDSAASSAEGRIFTGRD